MKVCSNCNLKFNSISWECPSCNYTPKRIDGFLAFSPELSEGFDSFKEEHFNTLVQIEAANFWFCSRNRIITWVLKRYYPNAKQFLELGCGTGFVLSGIEKSCTKIELFGVDLFLRALALARGRIKKAGLLQMDARQIPFENEFDVIGAFDILEHLNDDRLVLAQMRKALTRNGGIIITVPQYPFLWSQFDIYSCHRRRYTAGELKNKVEEAGFRLVRMTSFVSFLFPFLFILRFAKFQNNKNMLFGLRLNSFVNYIFDKIMYMEHALIRMGISFPFGGSLLLVARKV